MNDIFMYAKQDDYHYQVYDDEHQESRLRQLWYFSNKQLYWNKHANTKDYVSYVCIFILYLVCFIWPFCFVASLFNKDKEQRK